MQTTKQEAFIKQNIHAFFLNPEIQENGPEIEKLRIYAKTNDQSIIDELKGSGALLDHKSKHNIIATVGRNVLCRLLAGDTTYSGQINYGALGTAVAPVPAVGDIKLGTESYRKTYASHTTDGANIAYVDFFFATTDCNGTYTEFGNFIDGTASADSGKLFSRIATGGWTKTALQSLFVSCQYTIN